MVSTLMLIPLWQQRSTITVDCWVSNRSRRLKPALRICWPGWSDSGRWSGLVLRALGGGVSDGPGFSPTRRSWRWIDRTVRNAASQGKSDPTDAVAAARAVLSGEASVTPKSRDGAVEEMRVLLVARRSGREQRIQSLNQLRHLVFCAPEPIRDRFKDRPKTGLVSEAAAMRPHKGSDPITYRTNLVIKSLARRIKSLDAEMRTVDHTLPSLIEETAPTLLEMYGVGVDTAATLLVTAGDNPERLHNERSWAHLCGVTPLPANSGKTTTRFRLNPGGDRQANAALYRIVLTRMSSDPDTRRYVTRRRDKGLSTPEIMRCLKRYVARQTYKHLPHMIQKSWAGV